MPVFKITTVGASSGIILNKAAMARLRVKKGDRLYLTEAPGGFRLTPYDPEFARPDGGRPSKSCTTTARYCGGWPNEHRRPGALALGIRRRRVCRSRPPNCRARRPGRRAGRGGDPLRVESACADCKLPKTPTPPDSQLLTPTE